MRLVLFPELSNDVTYTVVTIPFLLDCVRSGNVPYPFNYCCLLRGLDII